MAIISDRLIIKENEIIILNTRIDKQQELYQSVLNDNTTYIAQLAIRKVELTDTNQQNQALKVEVKQLKKEKGVLKIGFVGVVVIAVYGWLKG